MANAQTLRFTLTGLERLHRKYGRLCHSTSGIDGQLLNGFPTPQIPSTSIVTKRRLALGILRPHSRQPKGNENEPISSHVIGREDRLAILFSASDNETTMIVSCLCWELYISSLFFLARALRLFVGVECTRHVHYYYSLMQIRSYLIIKNTF